MLIDRNMSIVSYFYGFEELDELALLPESLKVGQFETKKKASKIESRDKCKKISDRSNSLKRNLLRIKYSFQAIRFTKKEIIKW